jgi:hypothetical protein
MKRRLVEWVRRRSGFSARSHHAIGQLGGTAEDGTFWSLTADELIHELRHTADVYYVSVGGRHLVIEVCMGRDQPFLRCWDSGRWTNDLVQVPEHNVDGRR